jgi:hypothetical protein
MDNHHWNLSVLFASFAALLTALSPARALDGNAFEKSIRAFTDEHCTSCHGPEVQRAKLRLDTVPLNLSDKDTAATWVKVFDRVSRGEMPPKRKGQQPDQATQIILTELQKHLHEASRTRQNVDGRVVLRRLNRTEYENTLHDLLGTRAELKDLLPDDNIAAGFDNVSAVLEISPAHLLRYQDAAEHALRNLIPTRPRVEFRERRTGKQITEKMPTFKELLGKTVKLNGDTLTMYVRPWGHIPCSTAPAPSAGRYRVRASVFAVGSGGQPIPMMLSCRDHYGREDNDIRGVRDVPADKPAVIEGEFNLRANQIIVFTGWSLPTMRDIAFAKDPDKFTGAGLAVEWVELEGPIDPWPGVGYDRLFGGVPLKPTSVAKLIAAGQPEPLQPAKRHPDSYIYDPLTAAPSNPREEAQRLIQLFLPLVFRRPATTELEDQYVKIVHNALDRKLPFPDAMLLGYKAVLCSPHFLFLLEPTDTKSKNPKLDDYSIASRLSFFLWSSGPDDDLLALARKGELAKPAAIHAQVERMLKDPKSRRFTTDFAGQWLDLRSINATSPDPQIYGEFDDFLFWSMPRETQRFFEDILSRDASLAEFVHSDWTYLNQRLAQHYGIPGVFGGELRRSGCPRTLIEVEWSRRPRS